VCSSHFQVLFSTDRVSTLGASFLRKTDPFPLLLFDRSGKDSNSGLSKNLNAVVPEVDDDDVAVLGDADAAGSVHLSGSDDLRSETSDESSGRRKNLDAVVPGIGDDDVALLVDGDAVGTRERPVVRALQRKLKL